MAALQAREPRGPVAERELLAYSFEALARALYSNPGIASSLAYLSAEGRVFSFDYAQGGTVAELREGESPWSLVAGDESSLFFVRAGDRVTACRTVRRFEDRTTLGAIAVKLDKAVWERAREILDPEGTLPFLVLDSAGGELAGDGASFDGAMRDPFRGGAGLVRRSVAFRRGARDLLFAAPFLDGKLVLLAAVPLASIAAGARATMSAGLATGLASMLLSLALALLAAHRLARPIVALAARMESSGIPEDIEASARPHDEIAVLERSFNAMLGRIRNLIESEYRSEIELGKARLDALQARINPHYLHNSLNLVGGMALERGAPEIHRVVLSIGSTLRYATEAGPDLVALDRELESARAYLFVQEQRFRGKFSSTVQVQAGAEAFRLPRLSLQPVVENCFEHGFPGGDPAWRVEISARCSGGRLALVVSDNGRGMEPGRLALLREALAGGLRSLPPGEDRQGGGAGLANVHARLGIKFGPGAGIKVWSRPGRGTRVMILARLRDGGEEPCTES